jgi:hypothetical protein
MKRTEPNERDMKMEPTLPEDTDDLLPEYDLSQLRGGVRGKYFERYKQRLHLVRLSPDVAAAFPTEEAVNAALRMLLDLARNQVGTSKT